MKPLAARKERLIAESELNRAQMVHEWQMLADGVQSFGRRARTISWLASAAASLAAGFAFFRRKQSAPVTGKNSWLQTILKGAQLAGALWSEFRSRRE